MCLSGVKRRGGPEHPDSGFEESNVSWGDKPCDHPNIVKERYLGMHTTDYVCSTCGKQFLSCAEWEEEREQIEAEARQIATDRRPVG